jgi:uncharacterized protein
MRPRIKSVLSVLASLTFSVGVGASVFAAPKEKPWKPGQSVQLIMASGGVGGTYFPLAGGIAKLWADAIPGLNVTVQATGGSVANIRLLGRNEVDLAFVQNDVAAYGRTGAEVFAERKERYPNYLAIAALYPEPVQIVVPAGSSIRGIEDLKGKTVVVGAAASGTEVVSRQILAAYGLSYAGGNGIRPLFLGFAEGATALRENAADALVVVAGIPNAALADVQTVTDLRVLPIDLNKLRKDYGFYVGFVVPAGTYKGMDTDVDVVALKATLVASDEMHSALIYEMTKALFVRAPTIGHAKAKEFDAKLAVKGVTIPFHPGAARYFREKGEVLPVSQP